MEDILLLLINITSKVLILKAEQFFICSLQINSTDWQGGKKTSKAEECDLHQK